MLHHYTSVNTLALILKSRKMRFNRLDKVDDLSESNALPLQFKSYYFVSCWTKSELENISLWHMYTQMKGVRISFPSIPFHLHDLKPDQFKEFKLKQDITFPLPASDMVVTHSKGFKFLFIPYTVNYDTFDVIYCDDNEQQIKKSISVSLNKDNTKSYTIENAAPAIVKNSIWSFQEECRFILKLLPTSVIEPSGMKYNVEDLLEILSVEQEYFDIQLNEEMLNNIQVTLAPSTSEAEQIIVQTLLKEYTTGGKVSTSVLAGKIRS